MITEPSDGSTRSIVNDFRVPHRRPGVCVHCADVLSGVFRGSEALAAGALTRAALRGPRYRRLLPDVYTPAALEPDLALRSRAAYVWAGNRGVLTGYSAAEMLSAACAPAGAPAELALPGTHPKAPPGVLIRQVTLARDERRTYRGVELTTPVRTAYDLARRCSLAEAVVAVDALAGRFGFAPKEVLGLARRHRGARRTLRLPEVVALAEPLAASAMESRLRLVLVLGGLPRPAVQYRVPDRRAHVVASVDLAYPEQLIAIEYEGADHFAGHRVVRDVHRYTRLVDLGWRVYRYTADDVYQRPARIVAEITRALRHPR
ncbi:MAG: hypothetical protein QOC83_243 [Pseudonocardiales bacterium]|nr:hypothetical protein [Pseudonocardiales bacterium]